MKKYTKTTNKIVQFYQKKIITNNKKYGTILVRRVVSGFCDIEKWNRNDVMGVIL